MGKINRRNISLMELNENDVNFIRDIKDEKYDYNIKIGDIVVEEKPNIEDESFAKRFYKILGIVENVNEIVINSFLVKEVYKDNRGEWIETNEQTSNNTIFSLSRSDCKFLGITYQEGIEVYPFPNNYDYFHKVEENFKDTVFLFENYSNSLSRYPTSIKDNSIRRIAIQISGFRQYGDYIIFNDQRFHVDDLRKKLSITTRGRFTSQDGMFGSINEFCNITYHLISRDYKDNIVDSNGNIYVELLFCFKSKNTSDGIIGISPNILEDKTINDIITVNLFEIDTNPLSFRNIPTYSTLEQQINNINTRYKAISNNMEWVMRRK